MRGRSHHTRRKAEDFLPIHLNEMLAFVKRGLCSRVTTSTTFNAEQVTPRAVRMHNSRENSAGLITGLQDECARPIAEKNAGVTVLPVHKTCEGFRPNDQRTLYRSTADGLGTHIQSIDKPGAGRQQIKCACFCGAKLILYQAGCCREYIFRRGGGANNQVQVGWAQVCNSERVYRSFNAQGGRKVMLARHASFTDPGAFADPGVVRIHHL